MSLIEWNDTLSVGFPEMDKDHQHLVGILNKLYDVIEGAGDRDDIEDGLDELIEYTCWHFRHEERLMQEQGYEGLDAHREMHQSLAGKAAQIQEAFEAGDDSVLEGLMPFLKDWLSDHILGADKVLGGFLAEQSA